MKTVAIVSLSLTATVADAAGGGTSAPTVEVAFTSGATTLATSPLTAAGTASAAVASLGVGSHGLSASYGGDSGFSASTSPILTHVVRYAAAGTPCLGQPGHQLLQPVGQRRWDERVQRGAHGADAV